MHLIEAARYSSLMLSTYMPCLVRLKSQNSVKKTELKIGKWVSPEKPNFGWWSHWLDNRAGWWSPWVCCTAGDTEGTSWAHRPHLALLPGVTPHWSSATLLPSNTSKVDDCLNRNHSSSFCLGQKWVHSTLCVYAIVIIISHHLLLAL